MQYLYEVPHIRAGMDHLLTHDPVFARLGLVPEVLTWRYTPGGFPSLVRIVVGQQVSTSAARSMWAKFEAGVPDIQPRHVLKLDDETMRSFGLSRSKVAYIRGLSEAIRDGALDPESFDAMSDDAVFEAITALKGFGRWSADMYLMFSLARPDVWPAGDLGIQEGLRRYLQMDGRPDEARVRGEKARFSPHCTAASILLWHMASMKDIAVVKKPAKKPVGRPAEKTKSSQKKPKKTKT
jgi:DNA-3-methyladenine glycosylase II